MVSGGTISLVFISSPRSEAELADELVCIFFKHACMHVAMILHCTHSTDIFCK